MWQLTFTDAISTLDKMQKSRARPQFPSQVRRKFIPLREVLTEPIKASRDVHNRVPVNSN